MKAVKTLSTVVANIDEKAIYRVTNDNVRLLLFPDHRGVESELKLCLYVHE